VTQDQRRHPASWWAQFQEASERFDTAYLTEGLGDLITAKIASPLLRREAEIATGEGFALDEAYTLCHLLQGRYGEAANEAEAFLKTQQILRVFVGALRMERFDGDVAVKMLAAGQSPAAALTSGRIVGKYSWWPNWLLKVITERAMAGELDEETAEALDRCAYAELSPAQSRIARRLLAGEDALIDASAVRLESLGETEAAEKLRKGDLTAVAIAARLIPI
jgi:hypothetical protein